MLRPVVYLAVDVFALNEVFTTNAICRKQYCVNPVFPGLESLHTNEQKSWACVDLVNAEKHLAFCGSVVNYNPALPQQAQALSVAEAVKKQEKLATTAYFYHLSGMGLDAWDYLKPESSNDRCVEAIQRLVCYTYFPKCSADSNPKTAPQSQYLRPCQSSCENYIAACGVECCDESVACSFTHTKFVKNKEVTTKGYEPVSGPSSICTGGSSRFSVAWVLALMLLMHVKSPRMLLALALVAVALTMQGCDVDVPQHEVGNWRAEQDYLIKFQYMPPEGGATRGKINSCEVPDLASAVQCNSRGTCKVWDPDNAANPLMFCECDRDWADPECGTQRKSQVTAYFTSIFFGIFGADQFYLGYPSYGALKLVSLGGFGIWWVIDIVRIGAAPVYAQDYRVASDLPHWAFVLSCVGFAFLLGCIIVSCTSAEHIRRRRKDALLLQAESEEAAHADYPYSMMYSQSGKNFSGFVKPTPQVQFEATP